jgi:carboxypeptidase family protein/TonB-dependent receptor-like protein
MRGPKVQIGELRLNMGSVIMVRLSSSDVWQRVNRNIKFARKALPVFALAVAICLVCQPLLSQTATGAIQGVIVDPSGGVIPGATVTVTDVDRGVTRTLTTNNVGQYIATNLTAGTYTVRAEAKGFSTTEHTNVLVQVGETNRVDLSLQTGAQNQTVTVSAQTPEIDTSDATLGGTVSNTAIDSLPLNGRNFARLLDLRPGIYYQIGGHAPGGDATSTNGIAFGTEELMVEGVPAFASTGGAMLLNSEYRVGDAQSELPLDAIQEFNTVQNPKAEDGWRPGAIIDVGVKSGTNSIHGSAYAYGRDAQATDARNAFTDPTTNPAIPPETLEQFGGTAGGRIVKNKLFWFAAYEGLRTTLTNTVVSQVPADVSLLATDPTHATARSMVDACNDIGRANVNPLSARLAGLPTGSCTPQPASSAFENVFPFSNSFDYVAPLVSYGPLNNGLLKLDYNVSEHHRLSGFYYRSQTDQNAQIETYEVEPQWEASIPATTEMYAGNWTWTPNSNWVNEFRAGYGYMHALTTSADNNLFTQPTWPNGYGFDSGITAPTPSESQFYGGFPTITFGGFQNFRLGLGRGPGVRGPDGTANFIDNVSYLHGKHSFKFGFQFMDVVYDNGSYGTAPGRVDFNSLEDFLTGTIKRGSIQIGNPNFVVRAHWSALFAQDDFRVSPRFTLNMGLRWEYQAPPTDQGNYAGTFNPNLVFPVPQVGGAGNPQMYAPDYKDFSPRLGFAWDLRGNGKTVVRASYSILRDPELVGEYFNNTPVGANVPDLGRNTSGTQLNEHTPLSITLKPKFLNWTASALEPNATAPVFPVGNLPLTVQTPSGQIVSGLTGTTCLSPNDTVISGPTQPPCALQAVDPNLVQAFIHEWDLDVQRAITTNLSLDVVYVGTHGSDLYYWNDVNQPVTGAGWDAAAVTPCLASGSTSYNNCAPDAAGEVGPYSTKFPFLSNIGILNNSAVSNYNALQVTLTERPTHGLSFLAAYSLSHALDDVSLTNASGQSGPIDGYHIRLNYGPSDFNTPNRFTFAPTYAIPGIKSPGQMLQGWTVSGILSAYSGQPWFPSDGTDDITGTNEVNSAIAAAYETWNFTGPRSAFLPSPAASPCYFNADNGNSPLAGCLPYSAINPTPQPVVQAWSSCVTSATSHYAAGSQQQQLALAALDNIGCYITQQGGILTPPAYGTIGNATRNIFPTRGYFNVDFSVSKDWKLKERLSVQFRAEFFNVFNNTNFDLPGDSNAADPSAGLGFNQVTTTPDVGGGNPILGSGGPRHIQFALRLGW